MCGACCDPVHLDWLQRDKVDQWRDWFAEHPDDPPPPGSDQAFILAHWDEYERYDGGARYRCDRFDPDTRQCTAHDDRPDVCRNFPFYGRPGDGAQLEVNPDGASCSYWADVPPDLRLDGVRPLIPIEVLR